MDIVLRWHSREEKMKRLQIHTLAAALVVREGTNATHESILQNSRDAMTKCIHHLMMKM